MTLQDEDRVADEMSEKRRHFEQLHDDEAASYRLPNFFPSLSRSKNCSKCGSSMKDMACSHCGHTDWVSLLVILLLSVICLVIPFFAWTMQNPVAKWGCSGCTLISGLLFALITLAIIIDVIKAHKAAKQRSTNAD